jgi:hypothetical protein
MTTTNTPEDFKVGQRVELHPYHPLIATTGARFGEIRSINKVTGHVWVKLDKIKKLKPFHPDHILTNKNRNP